MNLRLLASTLSLALIAAAPAALAQDMGSPPPADAPPPPTTAPAGKDKPHTDLEKKMIGINRAMKKLKAQLKDPANNPASLTLVAQIHDAAVAALDLKPAKEKDLPDADQPKFDADYQAGMKEFIAAVDQLSDALKANDNDQANTLFQKLGQLERKDHKEFRKPEKE